MNLIRAFLISILALPVYADEASRTAYAEALQDWQTILEHYVDTQGRTDFVRLAESPDLTRLENFVALVGDYGPKTHPEDFTDRNVEIAYHTNVYNALAMHGVITEGIPEAFDSVLKRARFFKFRRIRIGGEKSNLHRYENKVIRPLDEPRTHFVLNCMVKDCPRLPQQAFAAEDLDQALDAATREFLSGEKYLRIDHEKRTIYVSAILDFYTKDFVKSGKARDLPEYINRYREEKLPAGYKVKFLKYDWTINQQP